MAEVKGHKLYPGEHRIIIALFDKGPLRFTDLKGEAQLSATTLSQYLKHLLSIGAIEQNEDKRYYFPKTLQPLVPKTFPTMWEPVKQAMASIKDLQARIHKWPPKMKTVFLARYLMNDYCLMMMTAGSLIEDANAYGESEHSTNFILRSTERIFPDWLQLLSMLFRKNDDVSMGDILDEIGADILSFYMYNVGHVLKYTGSAFPDELLEEWYSKDEEGRLVVSFDSIRKKMEGKSVKEITDEVLPLLQARARYKAG